MSKIQDSSRGQRLDRNITIIWNIENKPGGNVGFVVKIQVTKCLPSGK